MRTTTRSEEILQDLIHDLRQPLGNLETGVFYLNLVLDRPSERLREQMRMMERQVEQAAKLLERASEDLRTLRGQRDGVAAPESSALVEAPVA
ncbi:MAG TPA: hypothetical protein VHW09_19380 [Bryobacteraceae bacterium]|jgi:signal transduction histidine kinase|nr:hypothetical protein [Bryobacteraceae bacterium]